jgi:hypothetical protein
MGLERGPLSLVSTTEELLARKSSGSGLENREHYYTDVTLTTRHPLSTDVGTNFADKQRYLGRYSLLVDLGREVIFLWLTTYTVITNTMSLYHHLSRIKYILRQIQTYTALPFSSFMNVFWMTSKH